MWIIFSYLDSITIRPYDIAMSETSKIKKYSCQITWFRTIFKILLTRESLSIHVVTKKKNNKNILDILYFIDVSTRK